MFLSSSLHGWSTAGEGTNPSTHPKYVFFKAIIFFLFVKWGYALQGIVISVQIFLGVELMWRILVYFIFYRLLSCCPWRCVVSDVLLSRWGSGGERLLLSWTMRRISNPESSSVTSAEQKLPFHWTRTRGTRFNAYYIHSSADFLEHNMALLTHKVMDIQRINKSFFTRRPPLSSSTAFLYLLGFLIMRHRKILWLVVD